MKSYADIIKTDKFKTVLIFGLCLILLAMDIIGIVVPSRWPGTPVRVADNVELHVTPEADALGIAKLLGSNQDSTNVIYNSDSAAIPETSDDASVIFHPFLSGKKNNSKGLLGLSSAALPVSLQNRLFQVKYSPEHVSVEFLYDAARQTLSVQLPARTIKVGDQQISIPAYTLQTVESIPANAVVKTSRGAYLVTDLAGRDAAANDQKLQIAIYKPQSDNLLGTDGSFQNGLWRDKAGDCSSGLAGSARINMQASRDATDGDTSLELDSSNHFACTWKSFPASFSQDKLYVLGFDGKSVAGNSLRYYYSLENQDAQGEDKSIAAHAGAFTDRSKAWHRYSYIIDPSKTSTEGTSPDNWYASSQLNTGSAANGLSIDKADSFKLYFYASSTGTATITNRYDNVSLVEYAHDSDISLDFTSLSQSKDLVRYDGLKLPQSAFNITLSGNDANLLDADVASFETGLWQQTPSDCSSKLPGNPELGIDLSSDSTSGRNSMQLMSKNHFACAWSRFPLSMSGEYQYKLKVDYKSITGGLGQMYYRLNGQDGSQVDSQKIITSSNKWQTLEMTIEPRITSIDSIDIYLYAPSDGSSKVQIIYDNLRLQRSTPRDIADFTIASVPAGATGNSLPSVGQNAKNYWVRNVSIAGAKGPLLVVLPEKYDRKWSIANKSINSKGITALLSGMFGKVSGPVDGQRSHTASNVNAWWINPSKDCGKSVVCEQQADGSTTVSFSIVYKSRYISTLLAATILSWFAGVIWLAVLWYRHRTKHIDARKVKGKNEKICQ